MSDDERRGVMSGDVPKETEIKLRVGSAEGARALLARLGAFLVEPRHFEDNVLFDDAARQLTSEGRLLRLRVTPWANALTFKGPREATGEIKSRDEIETRVEDAAALRMILGVLGLSPVFRYEKYREVFEWDDTEIVIDETPIGVFIEIEGDSESIRRTAEALGFGPESYVAETYAELFFAAGGQGDMVFG
jgi:adenylate cyclase class 2